MSGHNENLEPPKMGDTTLRILPGSYGLLKTWLQVPGHTIVCHIRLMLLRLTTTNTGKNKHERST